MSTRAGMVAMFHRILRQLGVAFAAILVLGGVGGYLAEGSRGLIGAAMGLAIAAFFSGTTVVVMLATADRSLQTAQAAFVGTWIAKIILLFVALLLIKDKDFYNPLWFFVTLALALVATSIVEMRAALHSRVPAIDDGEASHR